MKIQLFVVLAMLSCCPADMLNDEALLEDTLRSAVRKAKLTLAGISMKKFQPQGVTGVAVLGESHVAIHSWPENGLLFVDIATCSDKESADSVFQSFFNLFPGAQIASYNEMVMHP